METMKNGHDGGGAGVIARWLVSPMFVDGRAAFTVSMDDGLDERYLQIIKNGLRAFGPLIKSVALEKLKMPIFKRGEAVEKLFSEMFRIRGRKPGDSFRIVLIRDDIKNGDLKRIDGHDWGKRSEHGAYGATFTPSFASAITTECFREGDDKRDGIPPARKNETILTFVVWHETGHLFGLNHHRGQRKVGTCVMHAGASLRSIVNEFADRNVNGFGQIFCANCAEWLRQLVGNSERGAFCDYAKRIQAGKTFEEECSDTRVTNDERIGQKSGGETY